MCLSLKAPPSLLVGQAYKLAPLPFASSSPSPGSGAPGTLSCTTLVRHTCACPVALAVHSQSRVCVGPLRMHKSQCPGSSALSLDRGNFVCSHSHTWLILHSRQVGHPCTCAQQHSSFCMWQPVCLSTSKFCLLHTFFRWGTPCAYSSVPHDRHSLWTDRYCGILLIQHSLQAGVPCSHTAHYVCEAALAGSISG